MTVPGWGAVDFASSYQPAMIRITVLQKLGLAETYKYEVDSKYPGPPK